MTRDTEKAFVVLYSEYLRRRSFGTAKNQAVRFEDSKLRAIDAFSSWHPSDIHYSLQELKKFGYISMDICGGVEILEDGINYMENKPNEYFTVFANAIKDLISLVVAFRSS